jgi:tRNA modification GTPase
MHDTPVRVALLTPPGRGALAVVGVAGAAALQAVARLFYPRGGMPLASRPDGAIAFGRWGDPDRGEELVVVRRTPESLEVHCHGGLAASAAVIESLEAAGAVRQAWPEWLAAAGASEIEIEAREALAQASGPKAARILARQLAGELTREIDRIATLQATGQKPEADAAVARLVRAARVGLRLTKPWRVVIAGPVNAGKSSLVNALAGHARSIVSAEPGTTRDVLETRIVLDGWEIDLIDTAGLRGANLAAASPTERAGIERAIAAAAEADLVVEVMDRTLEASATVRSVGRASGVTVISKCDLAPSGFVPLAGAIHTSTVTGEGIAELAATIVRRLVPEEHEDPALLAGPVPFTERQVDRLLRKRICSVHPLNPNCGREALRVSLDDRS